jgi:hypothetical protein
MESLVPSKSFRLEIEMLFDKKIYDMITGISIIEVRYADQKSIDNDTTYNVIAFPSMLLFNLQYTQSRI